MGCSWLACFVVWSLLGAVASEEGSALPAIDRTAFVTGRNARVILVQDGWKEVKSITKATLVWLRRHKSWKGLRPDPQRQIYNKMPTSSPMSNKVMLTENVQAYEEAHGIAREDSAMPWTIVLRRPSQFENLDTPEWREKLKNGGLWILKDSDASQGIGVEIIENIHSWVGGPDFNSVKRRTSVRRSSHTYVLQQYIIDPLLLDGRKSELRLYWTVLSLEPLLAVVFEHGQVRLNSMPYMKGDYSNRLRHITNIHQQEGHPSFKELSAAGKLKWSLMDWKEYLSSFYGYTESRLETGPLADMRAALVRALNATSLKMMGTDPGRGRGRFEMFGADFILTRDLRVYLTEIQMGPGLSHSDSKKAAVLKPALTKSVDLAFEVMQRKQAGLPLDDLDALKGSGFQWLVNTARQPAFYYR